MRRFNRLILVIMVTLWGGCRVDTEQVSLQTDEKVSNLLDAAWNGEAGPKPEIYLHATLRQEQRAREIVNEVSTYGVLTLEQAVQLAELTGPEYQEARELLYLTGLAQADAAHLYQLIPFAGGRGGYGGQQPNSGTETQAAFGLSQLLATGATIGADMTIGYVDVLTGDFTSGASSLLQAVATVPLLRGADRQAVLETLTQAEHDTLYAVRDFKRFRKALHAGVIEDYCRTAELAWQVRNTRSNLVSLEAAHASMKNLLKIGRVYRHEVDQTYQDILTAQSELGELDRNYSEALDTLKLRLHLPPQTECVLTGEYPLVRAWTGREIQGMGLEEAIDVTLQQRLDLVNSRDRVADAQRKVEVAADELQGDLSLSGLAAPVGRNDGRQRSRYELGLQGDLPLDRTFESSDYKRAQVALQAQERNDLQLRYQAISEVRQAWRAMREAQERYRVQDEARGIARKRLKDTSLLLHYGRASVRDVLDAQDDLYQAENAYISALTDYSIAQMNFLRDTGLLEVSRDDRGMPVTALADHH